jgi:hypothetical protein
MAGHIVNTGELDPFGGLWGWQQKRSGGFMRADIGSAKKSRTDPADPGLFSPPADMRVWDSHDPLMFAY